MQDESSRIEIKEVDYHELADGGFVSAIGDDTAIAINFPNSQVIVSKAAEFDSANPQWNIREGKSSGGVASGMPLYFALADGLGCGDAINDRSQAERKDAISRIEKTPYSTDEIAGALTRVGSMVANDLEKVQAFAERLAAARAEQTSGATR